MRRTATCILLGLSMTLAACTSGGSGDDGPGGKAGAAEPVSFDDKPLWTMDGGPNPDQAGKHSGLEEIYDVAVAGDYLVLAGYDEDGDLNDRGYDAGTIVVVDVVTGRRTWTVNDAMPLPDDDITIGGVGIGTEIRVIDDGGQHAIVIEYSKSDAADDTTESEFGVALLAVDNGKLLSHKRVAKESQTSHGLSISDVSGDNVLVNLKKDDDGADGVVKATMLNLATGKKPWSRDNASAVGGNAEAVLLEIPGKDNDDGSFEAIDPGSGDTLWDSRDVIDGFTELRSVVADVVIADTTGGAVALDIETGKQLDILKSDTVGKCVADTESLIACTINNGGLATMSVAGKSRQFAKVPDSDDFVKETIADDDITSLAVASNWVFTTKEGNTDDTYLAVDSAGNRMETPGKVGDFKDGIAVTYTGDMGAEVTMIGVHKVDG